MATTSNTNVSQEMKDRIRVINRLLDRILIQENLNNGTSIEINPTGHKGDGYLGDKNVISIRTADHKSLDLFVKGASMDAPVRVAVPIRELYEREIYFYDVILPTFERFQMEHKISEPFTAVAKCYRTSLHEGHEVLILEDLAKQGFVIHDQATPFDAEHAELVCRQYGMLHAVSYAMKKQQPEKFDEFKKRLSVNLQEKFLNALGPGVFQMIQDESLKALETLETGVLQRLKIFFKTFVSDFMTGTKSLDEFAVITHADTWCNNIFLKYDDNNKPVDVRLIDFQFTKLNSPVCDLSAFIFSCCGKEAFNKIDHLLDVYHNALNTNLVQMSKTPVQVLSRDDLKKQWKSYSVFGLGMAVTLLKLALTDAEDVVEIGDAVAGDKKFLVDTFAKKTKADQLYAQRLGDVVEYFVKHKLI